MNHPWNISTPHDSDHVDDGFSLLELVVAVSIMLILGVVGTVSYQTYTDNARQATVDSEASKVLTATVASFNAPNEEPDEAIKDYNTTTDEIRANIAAADEHGLTITALDRNGTEGVATIAGNFSGVPLTEYSEPGVTYEWTGERGASTSVKYRDEEEVARTTLPGFYGWTDNGSVVRSASRASIEQHAGLEIIYDIPEDVEILNYRFETRSTNADENGNYTFQTSFRGTSHTFGWALGTHKADGQWNTDSISVQRSDEHDEAIFRFRSRNQYTDTPYEVRNVQVTFDDEPFPEFFNGDSL